MPQEKKKRSSSRKRGAEGKSGAQRPRREGLSFSTKDSNVFPGPALDRIRKVKIPLVANCDKNGSVLTFAIHTSGQELLRLSPTPIHISYTASIDNPSPSEVATASAKEKAKTWFLTAQNTEDKDAIRVYIDPYSQFSTFFSSCEIWLDDWNLTDQLVGQGQLQGLFSYAQLAFMSARERERYFNIGYTVPDGEARFEIGNEENKKALSTMTFGATRTAATPRSATLSCAGVPLMGYPRCFQLSKLQKKREVPTYPFLPPRTKLMIKLVRQDPVYRNVEKIKSENATHSNNDAVYFDMAETYDDDLAEISLDIKDIYISGEIIRVDKGKLPESFSTSNLNYMMDLPLSCTQRIPQGQSHGTISFPMEEDIELAFFAFAFEEQLYFKKSSKRHCSHRMTVPKNLKKIQFFFDADEILMVDGLSGLEGTEKDGNLKLQVFYEYLRERDWLDLDFPDLFPRGQKMGYRAIIPLDMTPYINARGTRELNVVYHFESTGAPKNIMGVCIRVGEGRFTRKVDAGIKRWVMNPTISTRK